MQIRGGGQKLILFLMASRLRDGSAILEVMDGPRLDLSDKARIGLGLGRSNGLDPRCWTRFPRMCLMFALGVSRATSRRS